MTESKHVCGIDCGGGAWCILDTKPTSKAYDFENQYYTRPWGTASFIEAKLDVEDLHKNDPNYFENVIQKAKDILHPKDEPDYSTPFAEKVLAITDAIAEMLVTKNQAYGNSALDPVRIFSTASTEEQLMVRLDDKLSRIARGREDGEDVLGDILGYVILLKIARMEENNG